MARFRREAAQGGEFAQGQRVMTIDQLPGRVLFVAASFSPGVTEYEVQLDNNMGQGTYTASQLRPLPADYRAGQRGSNLPAGISAISAYRVDNVQPADHPGCTGARTVWLTEGSAPRCSGCGHRIADPVSGLAPQQTRDMGAWQIAKEIPSREMAKRAAFMTIDEARQAWRDSPEARAGLSAEDVLRAQAADVHTADLDYPEMGTVLSDRPDPGALIRIIGLRHYFEGLSAKASTTYGRPEDERGEDYNGGELEDTGMDWAEPAQQPWMHEHGLVQEEAPLPAYMPPVMARLAELEEAQRMIGMRHHATTINGTQIDDHGDAPGHGTTPRAADANSYDARSTEGDGDPKWSDAPPEDKRRNNGAEVGRFPEGISAGDGPGLEIGAFTASIRGGADRGPMSIEGLTDHLMGAHGYNRNDIEIAQAGHVLHGWARHRDALSGSHLADHASENFAHWEEHPHPPLATGRRPDGGPLSPRPSQTEAEMVLGLLSRWEADHPRDDLALPQRERDPDDSARWRPPPPGEPIDPVFGSRHVPWTPHLRGELQRWDNGTGAGWGDWVNRMHFTNESPVSEADPRADEEIQAQAANQEDYDFDDEPGMPSREEELRAQGAWEGWQSGYDRDEPEEPHQREFDAADWHGAPGGKPERPGRPFYMREFGSDDEAMDADPNEHRGGEQGWFHHTLSARDPDPERFTLFTEPKHLQGHQREPASGTPEELLPFGLDDYAAVADDWEHQNLGNGWVHHTLSSHTASGGEDDPDDHEAELNERFGPDIMEHYRGRVQPEKMPYANPANGGSLPGDPEDMLRSRPARIAPLRENPDNPAAFRRLMNARDDQAADDQAEDQAAALGEGHPHDAEDDSLETGTPPDEWPLAGAATTEGGPAFTQGSNNGNRGRKFPPPPAPPAPAGVTEPGQEGEEDGDGSGKKISLEISASLGAFVAAAGSPAFRFEFTAAWSDVVAKAKRIRKEGRVRITHASPGLVIGAVSGDHDVYETGIQRPPHKPQTIQHWACGCPWASFHQDKSLGTRYAGRPCSHVMALQFEAQARTMFGRQMHQDPGVPNQEVVVKSMPPWTPSGWSQTWLAPSASLHKACTFCPSCGGDRGDDGRCTDCGRHFPESDEGSAPSRRATAALIAAGEDLADIIALARLAGFTAELHPSTRMLERHLETAHYGDHQAAYAQGISPQDRHDRLHETRAAVKIPHIHRDDQDDPDGGYPGLTSVSSISLTADQANAPWGSQNVSTHPPGKPYGATQPPDKDMDPGSYGPLAGPDPDNWGSIQEDSAYQMPLTNTAGRHQARMTGGELAVHLFEDHGHAPTGWSPEALRNMHQQKHQDYRWPHGHGQDELGPMGPLSEDDSFRRRDHGDAIDPVFGSLPPHLAYPDISSWIPENQDSFGYSDRSNTAGPSTSLDPGDPNGIRMEESLDQEEPEQPGGALAELHDDPEPALPSTTGDDIEATAAISNTAFLANVVAMDLYHHTSPEAAESIVRSKYFDADGDREDGDPDDFDARVYFSDQPRSGQAHRDYGPAAVHVKFPRGYVEDEGEADPGEHWYSVNADHLRPKHIIGIVPPEHHTAAADGTIGGGDAGSGADTQDAADVAGLGEFGASAMGDQARAEFPQAQSGATVGTSPGPGSADEYMTPDDSSIQTVGVADTPVNPEISTSYPKIGSQQWSGGGADSDEDAVEPGDPQGSIDSIVAQFQATAGARQFAGGSDESRGSGSLSTGSDIAKAAREYLTKTADVLPKAEADELINEGRGERARNLGLLRLEGTHYEDEADDLAKRGLNLDDYDDDVISV